MKVAKFNVASKDWRLKPPVLCTALQKDWLTRRASLTQMLSQLGKVSVRVTSEKVTQPWFDEICGGVFPKAQLIWAREVVLSVNKIDCVVAHSITSLKASRSVWKSIRKLSTYPLADVLYHDIQVKRTYLASQRVQTFHPLNDLALKTKAIDASCARPLFARRSIFERYASPLMVTECLLPALWDIIQKNQRHSFDGGK